MLLTLFAFACCYAFNAFAQSDNASSTIIAEISVFSSDLRPNGITLTDCIRIRDTGAFRLERRRQQLPSPTAALNIYESTLDGMQLSKLHSIIEASNFRDMHSFVRPSIPATITYERGLIAHIYRQGFVQQLGFVDWNGSNPALPGHSRSSAAEQIKTEQEKAEVTLEPLLDWFREIEKLPLTPIKAEPSYCGFDATP